MKAGRKFVSVERLRSVAQKAILEGYGEVIPWSMCDGSPEYGPDGLPLFQHAVRLRLSMNCEDPYPFEVVARWSATHGKRVPLMAIFGEARCRKCKMCLVDRSRYWASRAFDEFKASPRTLLGTFTTTPEKDLEFDYRLEVGERGVRPPVDLQSLTEDERFRARASIIGDEITKWIKLVRKGQDRPLAGGHWRPKCRYLLIAEAHESEATSTMKAGRPHFHILLHEQEAGALILGDTHQAMTHGRSYEWVRYNKKTKFGWRQLLRAHNDAWIKTSWTHGHSSFELCEDANSAVYPCKYLSKSMRVRVRASQGYGGSGGTGFPVGMVPPSGTE